MRGDRGGDAGEHRVDDDEADAEIGPGERRAGIEPEPAEGEDERPEDDHRDVVPGYRLRLAVHVLADPWPDDDRAGKADDAAHAVHHARAGKVDRAVSEAPIDAALREPAAAPDPVGVDTVGQRHPEAVEEEVIPRPPPVDPAGRDRGHRVDYR